MKRLTRTEAEGIPLSHYYEHDGCEVLFTCESCAHGFTVPLGVVVRRLKALGVGDENTGVRAVARFVSKPCPTCGSRKITTRPGFQAAYRAAARKG